MKIGNNNINDCKIGNTDVNKIYIGNSLIWERSGSMLLPETQAIIDEALLLGYSIPSGSVITAMDVLISSMISSGWWVKQDIIFNWIYNNTGLHNFGLINWKNPSGTKGASIGSNLTMTVNGFQGNTTNYFDTNFTPFVNGVNYQVYNASRTFLIHTAATSGSGVEGNSLSNNGTANITARNQLINSNSNMSGGNLLVNTPGLRFINRSNSTTIRFRTAGGSFTNRTQTAQTTPNVTQTVFRNSVTNSNPTLSMYAMGASLTDLEVTSLVTAYNTYITAIGLTPFA